MRHHRSGARSHICEDNGNLAGLYSRLLVTHQNDENVGVSFGASIDRSLLSLKNFNVAPFAFVFATEIVPHHRPLLVPRHGM